MKAWSLASVTFVSMTFIAACGSKSDDKDTEAAATSAYTYDDVKSIINASCAATTACHGSGSSDKEFTSLAQIITEKPQNLIDRITSTNATLRMPKDGSATFATSADGVKLLDWLRGGSDL